MNRNYFFKTELNRDTLFYNVTTDLDNLYPNASVVLANSINSRERKRNADLIVEITNAINDGLLKLHLIGIFHQSEIGFGDNCITLMKGVLSVQKKLSLAK